MSSVWGTGDPTIVSGSGSSVVLFSSPRLCHENVIRRDGIDRSGTRVDNGWGT